MRTMQTAVTVALLLVLCRVASADDKQDSTPRPGAPVPTVGPYSWEYGPFQYDPSGNIAIIGSDYFVYDPMGRLVKASVQRSGQAGTQTYGYDAWGNRTSVDTTTYDTSTATNRLTSATYDAAGNLTAWAPPGSVHTRTYTYDSLNMMTKQTVDSRTEVYIYTADDERLWTLESLPNGQNVSHWTLRDLDGKVLRDFVDNGGPWQLYREYVYRDGQLLAVNTATGTEHYSLDHLDTPRLVTDGNGFKLFHHTYFPFGTEWTTSTDPVDGSTLRFTGHERDDDLRGEPTGTLDYMHARMYSSNLGRFLSVDPDLNVAKVLRQPQAWNRYSYVGNNPINRTDPTGRCFWDVCTAEVIGGLALAAGTAAYLQAPSATLPGKNNGKALVQSARDVFAVVGTAIASIAVSRRQRQPRVIIGETMDRVLEAAPQINAIPLEGITSGTNAPAESVVAI